MKLTLYPCELPLEHVFRISRGETEIQPSLIVEIEHEGISGYGEAPDDNFYGHSLNSLTNALHGVAPLIEGYEFGSPEELWLRLRGELDGNWFALSALDQAANDLYARLSEQRLFESWGLDWKRVPESSYTIGIDSVDKMVAKMRARPDWSCYKIKLGTHEDLAIVRELRRYTDATFRVDANCGWSVAETIANSKQLKELGVEFIEQPLPPDTPADGHQEVYRTSELPIIADENCLVETDVDRCHGLFHGINVKLCKCGGLTPARRMLRRARELGMRTMLGCMVESSVGISAAAQLAPLLDYLDLDGAELLASDPATGVAVENGVLRLPDRSGTGAALGPDILSFIVKELR